MTPDSPSEDTGTAAPTDGDTSTGAHSTTATSTAAANTTPAVNVDGSAPLLAWPQFESAASGVVVALRAATKAIDDAGFDKPLAELVKVRASQINGCAFCIHLHLELARKLGVDGVKLDLLAAWREAGVHTPRERAALAWTEALTTMDRHHPESATFAALQTHFSEAEIAQLTAVVGLINAWNRIAGGLRFTVPVNKPKAG